MINYYHYSSPFLILFFHIFSFLLVPFILHVINLGDVIPKLAYELNLDYYLYKMEPALVCLAVGTAYYVIFEIVFDVLQACRRWKPVLYDVDTHQTLVREEHPVFFTRLNLALRQLRRAYPPFVVSLLLLYGNTTRFNQSNNSIMYLQTIMFIIQTLATLYRRSYPGQLCQYFYRALILWTLYWAVFPQQAKYYTRELTSYLGFLEPARYHYRGGSIVYPTNDYCSVNSYNNRQQWIL